MRAAAGLAICLACGAFGQAVDPSLPPYRPQPIAQEARPYVGPSGVVTVIGYNDMQEMLSALDDAFVAAHPSVSFRLMLQGTRTAPPALAEGRSAFAPMGAEFSDDELAAYRAAVGSDPLMIKVAHDSVDPLALSAPLGVFVQRDNPLAQLTMAQLAAIFAQGDMGVQIVNWAQLGGADAPIHPLGLAAGTALAAFLSKHEFGDRPYLPSVTGFAQSAAVVAAVGRDPLAIGFAALNRATPAVKALALARSADQPPVEGSAAEIAAGRYPLDRWLLIYVRRTPGRPIDPLVRDYLNLVLSRQGQSLIAAGRRQYLPLTAAELAAERAKLD